MRRLVSAVVATLLAAAGAVIVATPAHAEPDVVETTLAVTIDPEMPNTAVLHAEMIGAYIDAGGAIPAGTWSFLVADDTGAALFMKDVIQPAAGPTSMDVDWSDVPAGIVASGIVSFAPSEASNQIDFAGATAAFPTEGTSANATDLNRTVETPTSTEASKSTGVTSDPISLALSILLVASLVTAAIGILLLVRRNRRSAAAHT